jgi:hypothetical protein
MRVVAFAASLSATEEAAGGVTAKGFPITSCYVDNFPAQIIIPMVVAFCASGGADYDPVQYIIATSADGERVGALEFSWHWPDNPPAPIKFRVFAQHLPMRVESAGIYTIGLHDSAYSSESDHIFPLPVHKTNPLINIPGGA